MNTKKNDSGFVSMMSSGLSLVVLVAALTITISLMASSATASSLGPSNAQRRALATTEARRLLTFETLPAGSTKLSAWIRADGPALLGSGGMSGDPDQVHLTQYFLAPGGYKAVNWLDAQIPKGGSHLGSGSSAGPGSDNVSWRSYSFHETTTFLTAQLQYSMLITPKGDLGLRVDADVTWIPRKSRYSIVPAGATKVVVIVNRGLNVKSGKVTTVTITDRATINDFLSHVDQLPALNPDEGFCPADVLASVTLRFFDAGSKRPYAVVDADSGGCGNVKIHQYTANHTLFGSTSVSGGYDFSAYVAKSLGITNWTGMSPA
jgi:hypothetical protein